MFAAPLCGLLMALLLAAPISANLSAISLTSTTDNPDLAFAWKIMEAHTLSSRVLCASMCERNAWCVAVALCQQSSTPLVVCGLVTVNVTLNGMHSDDLSHCRVHYSKKRLENLVSCGASHSPDLALSPCSTTTTTTTTPSPASGTTECVTDLGGGCDCPAGATNINCTTFISDCPSYWRTRNKGGVYTLQVADYPTPFQVYCDSGSITIQRRKDCGDEFFFRDWQAYRDGFGDINSECFWLGNKKIKAITDPGEYTLYVKTRQRSYVYSKYKNFRLSSEEEGYAMGYSAFSSASGWMKADYKDGFGGGPSNTRLQGMKFYTHDKDNTAGCALNRKSGWWYNTECAFGDLNQDEGAEWPDSDSGELTEYDDVLMNLYDYHHG